jgi:tetratricopeptide (TPR) repeat protein
LAADPTCKEDLGGMRKVEIMAGDTDSAQKYFDKIDDAFGTSSFASFFNNRAVAWVHAGKPQQAIELYQNALKFMTKFKATVLFNLGMANLRIGEVVQAADVLQQVLGVADKEFILHKQIRFDCVTAAKMHSLPPKKAKQKKLAPKKPNLKCAFLKPGRIVHSTRNIDCGTIVHFETPGPL